MRLSERERYWYRLEMRTGNELKPDETSPGSPSSSKTRCPQPPLAVRCGGILSRGQYVTPSKIGESAPEVELLGKADAVLSAPSPADLTPCNMWQLEQTSPCIRAVLRKWTFTSLFAASTQRRNGRGNRAPKKRNTSTRVSKNRYTPSLEDFAAAEAHFVQHEVAPKPNQTSSHHDHPSGCLLP